MRAANRAEPPPTHTHTTGIETPHHVLHHPTQHTHIRVQRSRNKARSSYPPECHLVPVGVGVQPSPNPEPASPGVAKGVIKLPVKNCGIVRLDGGTLGLGLILTLPLVFDQRHAAPHAACAMRRSSLCRLQIFVVHVYLMLIGAYGTSATLCLNIPP